MSFYTYDKIQIIGAVGKNAEMRYLPNGNAITSFSIAVDRSYKNSASGEVVKRTIWYRIQVFGKFAETCRDITKGQKLFVEGELQADWSTGSPKVYSKANGSSGASFEVTAQTVRFLSPRADSEGGNPFEPAAPDVGDGENLSF